MNKKAIALLSGGLDSMLAICIMKDQGIEIEAVNFQTMFGCCKDDARRAAYDLGVPFSVLKVGDDYLKVVENPKHGYGRGVNPCVDCRVHMFEMAKKHMEYSGASFMISGEVLGQRPMSQKRKDFAVIDRDTGLEGLILRPLSALRLPLTLPEKAGIVDRSKLFGVYGRSRQKLLELAAYYGIVNPPDPSAGCALTSPDFAKKVRDIFKYRNDYQRWEFELLKMGRHFRLNENVKLVVARNQEQNEYFQYLHPKGTSLLVPLDFVGPLALLIGKASEADYEHSCRIMLRYAQKPVPARGRIQIERNGEIDAAAAEEPVREAELEKVRIV